MRSSALTTIALLVACAAAEAQSPAAPDLTGERVRLGTSDGAAVTGTVELHDGDRLLVRLPDATVDSLSLGSLTTLERSEGKGASAVNGLKFGAVAGGLAGLAVGLVGTAALDDAFGDTSTGDAVFLVGGFTLGGALGGALLGAGLGLAFGTERWSPVSGIGSGAGPGVQLHVGPAAEGSLGIGLSLAVR